jgi:phosphoribosyl-AMP cyclohydrolase
MGYFGSKRKRGWAWKEEDVSGHEQAVNKFHDVCYECDVFPLQLNLQVKSALFII